MGDKKFLQVGDKLSFDCLESAQTFSYAFHVEGMVEGQQISFDIFGCAHSMPFKCYHSLVQDFLLKDRACMITESRLHDSNLTLTNEELIIVGACTQDPNPIFQNLNTENDLETLRKACSGFDAHLKRIGFHGIENLTSGFFAVPHSSLFWGGESEIAKRLGFIYTDVPVLEDTTTLITNIFTHYTAILNPHFEHAKSEACLIETIIDLVFSTELKEDYLKANNSFFDTISTSTDNVLLLNERNEKWLSILIDFVQKNKDALVTVGAAHLFDSTGGLLTLFKGKGLSVKFLDLKTNEWCDYADCYAFRYK